MIIAKAINHDPDVEKFVYFSPEGKYSGTFGIENDEFLGKIIWNVVIFKRYRGNGYCVKMLGEFLQEFPGKYCLIVKKDNVPAIKSYLKLGFSFTGKIDEEDGEYLWMEKL